MLVVLLSTGACREVERHEKRWTDVAVDSATGWGDGVYEVRACALAEDGEVRCFGCEYWIGSDWLDTAAPCTPPRGDFVAVDVFEGRTCGVREDGEALCWGFDDFSELAPRLSPADRLVSVAAGPTHNCGLDEGGDVVCWGCDPTFDPDADLGAACGRREGRFVHVVPVRSASCALDEHGEITCWGYYGGPVPLSGMGFTSFDMVVDRGCGVTDGGVLACWGWDVATPAGRFIHVAVNERAGCALSTHGSIRCWGEGEIVDEAPRGGTYETLDLSDTTACAVTTAGGVVCWGVTNPTLLEGPEPEVRCR